MGIYYAVGEQLSLAIELIYVKENFFQKQVSFENFGFDSMQFRSTILHICICAFFLSRPLLFTALRLEVLDFSSSSSLCGSLLFSGVFLFLLVPGYPSRGNRCCSEGLVGRQSGNGINDILL